MAYERRPFGRQLHRKGQKPFRAYIHQAVLTAFGPPQPADKPLALHRDDDQANNQIGNLYWGDEADNLADKARNRKGDEKQVSPAFVAELKFLGQIFKRRFLARMYDVSYNQVSRIIGGRSFRKVAAIEFNHLMARPTEKEMQELAAIGKQGDDGTTRPYTQAELVTLEKSKFAIRPVRKE